MEKAKISNIQLGFLTFGFLYGNTAIMNAIYVVRRDSWLVVVQNLIFSLGIVTIYLFISEFHPDKNLVEILQYCFGRIAGSIIAFLYLFTFLHLGAMNLRNLGDFLTTVSFPETPMIIILLLILCVITYAVSSGLEVLGRISEVLVPFIPLAILFLSTSVITISDFSVFFPVLEGGYGRFLSETYGVVTFPYGDLITFLMIYPYLNKQKGKFKATYTGVILVGTAFLIIAVRNLVVLGPELIENTTYVTEIIAKLIPGVSIEPIIDINLLIGGGLKISVFLYAVTKGVAQLSAIKDYRPLVPAFSVLTLVVSLWVFVNDIEEMNFLRNSGNLYFVFPLHIAVPVIVLIISLVKRKKHKGNIN